METQLAGPEIPSGDIPIYVHSSDVIVLAIDIRDSWPLNANGNCVNIRWSDAGKTESHQVMFVYVHVEEVEALASVRGLSLAWPAFEF